MDDVALERIVASVSRLADSTGAINYSVVQLAGVVRVLAERLHVALLREHLAQHGYVIAKRETVAWQSERSGR